MKRYLLIFNTVFILISLFYGIFSGGLSRGFAKMKEGERLFVLLNIKFKDEIVFKETGFRYTSFTLVFQGNKFDKYNKFLLERGYINISNVYCKLDNSVSLESNNINIILNYGNDSDICKR